MNKRLPLWVLAGLWMAFSPSTAAAALAAPAVQPKKAAQTPLPAAPAKLKPPYMLYNYQGERYRDPFIPLTGEAAGNPNSDRPPQIASLTLKGIIQDARSRVALLSSGVESYILRNGRLYNGRNLQVKGISGIIKTNSVVLIGSDRSVKELRVKEGL